MDEVNITDEEGIINSVNNKYEINIPNVTGNIVITATAERDSSIPYINWIPQSVDRDRITLYNNGLGYKTGLRLNSNNNEIEVDGLCLTGFIPCKEGDIVRIKNVTVKPNNYETPYLMLLSNFGVGSGYTIGGLSTNDLKADEETGIITVHLTKENYPNFALSSLKCLRLSFGTIDDTSILTINEEII
jgi:hypothetical protein